MEQQIILLLGVLFLGVFLFGRVLDKFHIPSIFVALILGVIGAYFPEIKNIVGTETFDLFSFLGINFLLFLIGFELEFSEIKKLGKFIVSSAFAIILSEAFVGGLIIHFLFHYSILLSMVIGLSFATVGEAILIPILEKLGITKSKLGQTILGVATVDDIFEVISIVLVSLLLPIWIGQEGLSTSAGGMSVGFNLGIFGILIVATILLIKLSKVKFYKQLVLKYPFLFTLAIFFIFISVGNFADLSSLGALFSGIIASQVLADKKDKVETFVKNNAFYFFGPIFFFSVGVDTDLKYLLIDPLMGLIFLFGIYFTKIFVSYQMAKNRLGHKKAIFFGISLGVRFSTSIVIMTILLQKGIMSEDLFSVLVSITILAQFVIPALLSYLGVRWKNELKD